MIYLFKNKDVKYLLGIKVQQHSFKSFYDLSSAGYLIWNCILNTVLKIKS